MGHIIDRNLYQARSGQKIALYGVPWRSKHQEFQDVAAFAARGPLCRDQTSPVKKWESSGENINFECTKCWQEFDCDVGKISLSDDKMRPVFEKDIVCPMCGKLSIDDVLLTELGQSQMTQATWSL